MATLDRGSVLSPSAREALLGDGDRDGLVRAVQRLEALMASLERALREGDRGAGQPARAEASR